jgi:type IV pilus assembly protein PilE
MKISPGNFCRGFNETGKNMKNESGVTLIELMIVVVIVGILIGVSVPAFKGYVLRSHRADAHAALLNIASREERFIAQNNTYTTQISAANGLGLGTTTTPEGYYNLTVNACGAGTIATCYLITADAVGSQTGDGDCLRITYDSLGVKAGGPGATVVGECW